MYTFGQRSDFGSRAVSGRHMLGRSATGLDKFGFGHEIGDARQ
jgi:hypothetical protein